MYTPAHIRATTDMSAFYEKTPAEMSRYELQELEKVLRINETEESQTAQQADEVVLDSNGVALSKEDIYKKSEEYMGLRDEVRKLQPMRIGVFKRYWDKFKYNKARREMLMDMFDETDEQISFYLGDEFKNWRDEIEGVRPFLLDLQKKKIENDQRLAGKGNTVVRTIKGKTSLDTVQQITYSSSTFNPYDKTNIKAQESNMRKVYIEKDANSSEESLTLGSESTEQSEEEHKK
jgi:hypothetical protein